MAQYPSKDSERDPGRGARIIAVETGSPADDAGFEPGCVLTSVDGEPLRDVIDWRWLASGDEIEVGYIDLDGDAGSVGLWREPGQDWGFEFDGLVFDGVKQCRNACTFCFMHQLPRGMRPSLYLRDDDFRLSFLVGTFVTLTNLTAADEVRIVEQRISPLRVSLQVSDADVRRRLIGRHASHGLDALDRLLAAGIEFHAQIVLVPGENDGDVLAETLRWAYARPGILNVGIVPLGYTRHQTRFDHSFNDASDSLALLETVRPFQERALAERGHAWAFAADEFYRNAYRDDLLAHVPPTAHYGDFSLFEDGIGIIRSAIDDWEAAEREGLIADAGKAAVRAGVTVRAVAGYAQREFLDALVARSQIGAWFEPLYVRNDYFGGNVDVTGLLTAQDIVRELTVTGFASPQARELTVTGFASPQARGLSIDDRPLACGDANPVTVSSLACGDANPVTVSSGPVSIVLPDVIFNDDGLTLDDRTLEDMESEVGVPLRMVSCSPLDYFREIAAYLREAE